MKASNVPTLAPFILKLAGIVLVLLYLLDLIVLLLFAKFQDSQWLLAFTTQLIDRGFVPLIGFALLFAGLWADSAIDADKPGDGKGLRLSALFLSSILGLLFLLLAPLHVNTTRTAADDQMKQIGQEATKAEGQIEAQVQQLQAQLDAQIASIDQADQVWTASGRPINPSPAKARAIEEAEG